MVVKYTNYYNDGKIRTIYYQECKNVYVYNNRINCDNQIIYFVDDQTISINGDIIIKSIYQKKRELVNRRYYVKKGR